jgi:hypothetical protein
MGKVSANRVGCFDWDKRMLDWLAKRIWFAPALVLAYAVFCLVVVTCLNIGVPLWLEAPLAALLMPAQLAIFLVAPLLGALGLMTGEWFSGPTWTGLLVAVAFYTFMAWWVIWVVTRLFGRR